MRITNATMTNSYLKDVQNNLQSIDKLNTQLNSGKNVNKVSDNPYEAIKILNMQNEINDVERYNYNCDEITGWINTTDDALGKIGNITSEIKVLLTSISGAYGEDEVNAIKSEVNEKVKQIGEALNSTYAGRFIFGGSNTDEAPFEVSDTNGDGNVELIKKDSANNDKLRVDISDGITVDYNLTADQVTNGEEGINAINGVLTALSEYSVDKSKIQTSMDDIDKYMNHTLNKRAAIGAKSNTVENVKSSNEENILKLTNAYSGMQDVDWTEKYIELKSAEMVYNSCMQVGAKLIQPTLLDYMR